MKENQKILFVILILFLWLIVGLYIPVIILLSPYREVWVLTWIMLSVIGIIGFGE